MESVPQWLIAAVDAAGMTAYADDIVPISNNKGAQDADSETPVDGLDLLH